MLSYPHEYPEMDAEKRSRFERVQSVADALKQIILDVVPADDFQAGGDGWKNRHMALFHLHSVMNWVECAITQEKS